jgi:hypothetical protein
LLRVAADVVGRVAVEGEVAAEENGFWSYLLAQELQASFASVRELLG